jgi:hypothetical protein
MKVQKDVINAEIDVGMVVVQDQEHASTTSG